MTAQPALGNRTAPPDCTLVCADSGEFVKTLPDQSVRLVVTSPPYNIGKTYEKRVPLEEYLAGYQEMIAELVRVTADDGSICWQVGNHVDQGEVYPLDVFFYHMFKQHGLRLRNRIIWHYGHGLHAKKRFSGRYETLMWFTKTDDYVFNLDSVRVPSKYPGKRHHKGPKAGEPSCNPLGKNPSDFWEFLAEEWRSGVLEIPNVNSNHPEKTTHPCQFPVELAERCVLGLTNENDTVLDPYAGVGSTVVAALKHGRKGIGIDKDDHYVEIARQRVEHLRDGTLRTRPLGRPVFDPAKAGKLAVAPPEWADRPSLSDTWKGQTK